MHFGISNGNRTPPPESKSNIRKFKYVHNLSFKLKKCNNLSLKNTQNIIFIPGALKLKNGKKTNFKRSSYLMRLGKNNEKSVFF